MRSHLLKMLVSEPIPNSADEEELGMDIFERYKYEHQFKVGWCPICNQGWQVIMKDRDGTLMIGCTECLSKWMHPGDAKDQKKVSSSDDLSLKAGEKPYDWVPTYQEILEQGWDKFLTTEN